MASFRREILQQIEGFEPGRIFTFADLSFDVDKTANVAVLVSEQCRKGNIARIQKGAYYRPKKSALGLGNLPVYQDEKLIYITKKLRGYLTGVYVYNKMGLTEQVAVTLTIATRRPVRRFRFNNLEIECVKAYCDALDCDENIGLVRMLDAIKDIKHIPGTCEQDVYDRLKNRYFSRMEARELEAMVRLAKKYPPGVRKVVSDMLGDIGQPLLQAEMAGTLIPTTRFNFKYRTYKDNYEFARKSRDL